LGDSSGVFIFTSLNSATTANNPTPKVVEAKGCYLGLESSMSLADYLKNPACTLESLSLEWNSVGSFANGLQELSLALSLNTSLTHLDLRNNNVGEEGGACLARALRSNRTLRSLDLRWNELGNTGGLAFKELMQSGSSVTCKDIRLAGNKMSDSIMNDIDNLLKRMSSTAALSAGGDAEDLAQSADDYHVLAGKNEQLTKELSKLSAEVTHYKNEAKVKDSKHSVESARNKNELLSRIENLEKQLTDSAANVSMLEIEVLREKERADRLQDNLTKEQREKDTALSQLRVEKEGAQSKKIGMERDKSQLQMSLKVTQETVEVLRGENDELRLNAAAREKELLVNLSDRERKLSEARGNEDKARAEQSRVEIALGDAKLKQQMAEDRATQSAKLLDECIEDRSKQVEDARAAGLESLENLRNELTGRLKAAEARMREAETKQAEAEAKARKSEALAASISVQMEQRISDVEQRIRGEVAGTQDGEVRGLSDALDVIKAQRESQDQTMAQLTADLANIRDMRERESESAKKTIANLNKSLSEALTEARRERGVASDLKLECASLSRQIEPFKRRVETAEAEKKRTEEFRQKDVESLQQLLANEREERSREAVNFTKRFDECNQVLRTVRENMSEQKTQHMKEFHKLEKGMLAAVQAIFSDRKGLANKKAGAEKGGTGGEQQKENTSSLNQV
jgi:chromosome segregation ATPase